MFVVVIVFTSHALMLNTIFGHLTISLSVEPRSSVFLTLTYNFITSQTINLTPILREKKLAMESGGDGEWAREAMSDQEIFFHINILNWRERERPNNRVGNILQ